MWNPKKVEHALFIPILDKIFQKHIDNSENWYKSNGPIINKRLYHELIIVEIEGHGF